MHSSLRVIQEGDHAHLPRTGRLVIGRYPDSKERSTDGRFFLPAGRRNPGRAGPARAAPRAGGAALGCRDRRCRAQRTDVRGLPGPGGEAGAGARSTRRGSAVPARSRRSGRASRSRPVPISPGCCIRGSSTSSTCPAAGSSGSPPAAGLFVPFEDGESVQLWDDDAQCEAEVARLAPGDVAGWRALGDVKAPAPRRPAAARRR